MLAALLLVAGNAALGETIQGRVVGIADGDTATVLDSSKTQHKIRLAGIDAPERRMPFGQRAKEHLSDLVFGKDVNVETSKKHEDDEIHAFMLTVHQDGRLHERASY